MRCIGVCFMDKRQMEEPVRWNIKVSKETDLTLRTFLGSQGMKKGDLSKFIEQAVRCNVFHRTVQDIKRQNAATDPGELQSLIEDTVRQVRVGSGNVFADLGLPNAGQELMKAQL